MLSWQAALHADPSRLRNRRQDEQHTRDDGIHNARADLLRKQQVLGSNPSVGSNPPFSHDSEPRRANLAASDATTLEDLLTERIDGLEDTRRRPANRFPSV